MPSDKPFNVLLVGELAIDRFVYGECPRRSPEAPCMVHKPSRVETNPGMAGNVKANLKSLSPGIRVDFFHQSTDIIKTRYIDEDSGQHLMRADEGDDAFEPDCWIKLIDFIGARQSTVYDAIVISDYGKGFLSVATMGALAEIARELNIPTFLDTKAILGDWSRAINFIKINDKEYHNQLANGVKTPWTECGSLLVTHGKDGIDLYNRDGSVAIHEPAVAKSIWSVAGAGDSVLAALVVRYLETRDIQSSMSFAMKAASVAVSRPGVVAVAREEVDHL
jgi:bifunctional ADP-heptose synthase (sugar kinase/adenylyltransferase)